MRISEREKREYQEELLWNDLYFNAIAELEEEGEKMKEIKAKPLGLQFVWDLRLKFWEGGNKIRTAGDKLMVAGKKLWREGNKIRTEGAKLSAEGEKLWREGNKIRTEGDKLSAEGEKLWMEGDKLSAEGDKLWAEAIIEVYGNIEVQWEYNKDKQTYECHLETGEVFKP
jgi:hypothetical protein